MKSSSSIDLVSLVAKLQNAIKASDSKTALSTLSKDCVVTAPLLLPWGGTTHNLDDFAQTIGIMANAFEVRIEHFETYPIGEQAMAIIQAVFTSRQNGRSVPMSVIERYRGNGNAITEIVAYYQNPNLIADILGD